MHADGANRLAAGSRYESRCCAKCHRDYLYPFYGGYKYCHDCKNWRGIK